VKSVHVKIIFGAGESTPALGKGFGQIKTEDLLTVGMFQNFIHFFFDRQNFIAVTPIFHIFIL